MSKPQGTEVEAELSIAPVGSQIPRLSFGIPLISSRMAHALHPNLALGLALHMETTSLHVSSLTSMENSAVAL